MRDPKSKHELPACSRRSTQTSRMQFQPTSLLCASINPTAKTTLPKHTQPCKVWSWGSGKISIVIRGYPCNEYNATVYGQRCKACNELGRLKIDVTSYVDRVSHRLMVWAGVPMEPRQYVQKETLPHMEELCEACRRGVCRQQDI
jgi:hypothetical protein